MSDVPALSVEDACKSYGTRRALDGLSLEVGRGEWVGLLGPNGAGKSTLMRGVAGLVPLGAGRVRFEGRELESAERAAAVGFVPQEIALYPLLTAEENLRFFGRLAGVSEDELDERVAWALVWTGLASRMNDRVGTFSGGMKRRLNIACGVLHKPRVVLLDEPTVGVDPQGRQRIWKMLEELRREGAALLQSTHELHEIESICDRMLIVDHGRVLAEGAVDELVERHLGPAAELHLELESPPKADLGGGFEVENNRVRGQVSDLATELPPILESLRAAGIGVRSLKVERPGLEAVFTHLTGRELRE